MSPVISIQPEWIATAVLLDSLQEGAFRRHREERFAHSGRTGTGMIKQQLIEEQGLAIVEPQGPLSEEDFSALTVAVDHYLESHKKLSGLLIRAEHFPGWENFQGFIHHMKFVKDHHKKIEKVALVTDTKMASILPRLADHFVSAEVKAFHYADYDDALAWIQT